MLRRYIGADGTLTVEAQVFKTPQMASDAWQHTVDNPNLTTCIRSYTNLRQDETLVSITPLPLPAGWSYARAYQLVIDARIGSVTDHIVDALVFAKHGRSNLAASVIGVYQQRTATFTAARLFLQRMLTRAA
jgi:hypothetical protein